MEQLGLSEADSIIRPRLVLSLSGLEKTGKTHTALTAPGPIAYLNFDIGDEGVVGKFKESGKQIFHRRFSKPMSFGPAGEPDASGALAEWIQFSRTWYKLLGVEGLRTIILDTETESWELARLARLGKLSQVKPHHYGPVNAEYNGLLKAAYDSDKNVILIGKMKKEYKNDKWNGGYERAGMSGLGFIVQVILQTFRYDEVAEGEDRVKDSFAVVVKDCRQNPALKGEEFCGVMPWDNAAGEISMTSFPWIASQVIEGTTPEDWE